MEFNKLSALIITILVLAIGGLLWLATLVAAPTTQLVYLSNVSEAPVLTRIDWPPSTATVLAPELDVFDFAVANNGDQLMISAYNAQGGIDLWRMPFPDGVPTLWLDCGVARCIEASWAVGDERLAYTRQLDNHVDHVWSATLADGAVVPLFDHQTEVAGSSPQWSPDGSALAFYDFNAGGIHVIHIYTAEESVLPTTYSAQIGSWAADGSAMVFNDAEITGLGPTVTMFRATLDQTDPLPLFQDQLHWRDFGPPQWAPVDDLIAFSVVDTSAIGRGNELWVATSTGLNPQPVATESGMEYGGYRWSGDGRYLLYQQREIGAATVPTLFVWDKETQRTTLIATDAALGQWSN